MMEMSGEEEPKKRPKFEDLGRREVIKELRMEDLGPRKVLMSKSSQKSKEEK